MEFFFIEQMVVQMSFLTTRIVRMLNITIGL